MFGSGENGENQLSLLERKKNQIDQFEKSNIEGITNITTGWDHTIFVNSKIKQK